MRVTHLGQHRAAMARITGSLSGLARAESQVASGKRITRASEDPAGMSRALELRARLRAHEQERRNIDDGQRWIDLADLELQSAVDQMHRVRELAIRGANTTNAEDRASIAAEVTAVRDSLVSIANTRHQGRGIFAGFATGDAVTKIGGVWTYTGDAGAVMRRVSDDLQVQVNVTAYDAFGFASGNDVLTVLDDLETALLTDDAAGIDSAIADVSTATDTLLESLATLGSAGRRIERASIGVLADIELVKSEISNIEDVDLSEALLELSLNETAYQAAMTAFARASQSSLVDFLR